MKWLFIIGLILNGLSQGNNIDKLFAKISTIEHEKSIMRDKIKELEEDVYRLQRKIEWKNY